MKTDTQKHGTLGTKPRSPKPQPTQQQKRRIQKWVDALRSGKYNQGTGCLKSVGVSLLGNKVIKYCCLGVAAVVAGKRPGKHSLLPKRIVDHFGLIARGNGMGKSVDVDVLIGPKLRASVANDIKRWSFKRIAMAIERYYGLKQAA